MEQCATYIRRGGRTRLWQVCYSLGSGRLVLLEAEHQQAMGAHIARIHGRILHAVSCSFCHC